MASDDWVEDGWTTAGADMMNGVVAEGSGWTERRWGARRLGM